MLAAAKQARLAWLVGYGCGCGHQKGRPGPNDGGRAVHPNSGYGPARCPPARRAASRSSRASATLTGVSSASARAVAPGLRHLELFTPTGLLTFLWHGTGDERAAAVVAMGGAMGGLLGPCAPPCCSHGWSARS